MMMAARPFLTFRGISQGGSSSTTGSPHADTEVGDFMMIQYFSGRTITQAAGAAAFDTITFGDTSVSSRRVTQEDLDGSFSFSAGTPYLCATVAGPTELSEAKTIYSGSGVYDGVLYDHADIPGVTPSFNSAGLVMFAVTPTPEIAARLKDAAFYPGPFDHTAQQWTTGLSYAMGLVTDMAAYAPGTDFRATQSNNDGMVARVYELLV